MTAVESTRPSGEERQLQRAGPQVLVKAAQWYDEIRKEAKTVLRTCDPENLMAIAAALDRGCEPNTLNVCEIVRNVGKIAESIEYRSRPCFICGAQWAKACQGCLLATYCSEECQSVHWPTHKSVCRQWKRMRHTLARARIKLKLRGALYFGADEEVD